MMAIKTKAWSILQGSSFFPLAGKTRKAVIAEFVWPQEKFLFENTIRNPNGPQGTLSRLQKDAWAKCEARGCKAVRVLIVEDEA